MSAPTPVPHRVLPTLNPDGTRRRIRPQLARGGTYATRRWVAWALMGLFFALPWIRVGGRPLLLLDLPAREFTLVGATFYATDGVLLMLLLLSIFIGILWLTALVGRAWCGYACPQTVYLEFLYRPIERLFEGDANAQQRLDARPGLSWRRVAKNAVFLLVSVALANVFLGYFVPRETLWSWITTAPTAHPEGFAVMATTAALVFINFAYFREQMCTVACPYARLQSALLDGDSLVIGYDDRRGEPRGHVRRKAGAAALGDCVDCGACVRTCPTGIDIRDGLQADCIACGQCIDACAPVMAKLGRPSGLIRYASQRSLRGELTRILRPRVMAYGGVLLALCVGLVVLALRRPDADVTVLRGIGAPFQVLGTDIQNQVRVKVENHAREARDFKLEVRGAERGRWIAPENPLHVPAGGSTTASVFVVLPRDTYRSGRHDVTVLVTSTGGFSVTVPYRLLGPWGPTATTASNHGASR